MQKLEKTSIRTIPEPTKMPSTVVIRSFLSNLLMTLIGCSLIYWSYHLIKVRMSTVISKDAVINGVLIDLKTPSEGIIKELSAISGTSATQDKVLMVLKNERVSKLEIQEIISQLNDYKTQLKREQAQLEQNISLLQRNSSLLQSLTAEQENYRHLRVQGSQQSVDQIKAQLQVAKARLEFSEVNYERISYLKQEGALAEADLEKAKLEKQESTAQITQLEAQLKKLNTNEKAAQVDLSLNWNPSNFNPKIRLKELELDIADQRLAIQALQQSIKDTQLQLKEAQTDYAREQSTTVTAPVQGIIWSVDAQKGQYVEEGDSLGKVLDCKRRWIDVYLEEEALQSIQPNTSATIELYGNRSEILQGRVSLVRSGIGRLAPGEEVAVPLIPNLPRQSQVRIDLEANSTSGDPQLFCYVGYTAKVTFNVK